MKADERTTIGEERREGILRYLLARFEAPAWDWETPTYDDIAKAIGLRSKSTVGAHLEVLRADGFVEWKDRRPATLRLTERGYKRAKALRRRKK